MPAAPELDFSACAWIAVIATVFTMSRTVAPRERSLTGLLRPCRIGPIATAPADRWTALYVLLPVLRSGKMNTVARPATSEPGSFAAPTDGIHGGVVLDRTVDGEVGTSRLDQLRRGPDLVDVGAACRTRRSSTTASRRVVRSRTAAAVAAEEMAMPASSSTVGSGMTAQSP